MAYSPRCDQQGVSSGMHWVGLVITIGQDVGDVGQHQQWHDMPTPTNTVS